MRNALRYSSILIVFACLSCATVGLEQLRPPRVMSDKLPRLEPAIDVASLEAAFAVSQAHALGTVNRTGVVSMSGSTVRDRRVRDYVTLYERDVLDNICESAGDVYGRMEFRITGGEARKKIWLQIPSGLSLCLLNLFGMPMGYVVVEMEAEVRVYDSKNQVIGRYAASTYQKARVGPYYGISGPTQRMTAIDAYNAIMKEIKGEMQKDVARLRKALLDRGPVGG
ncbi:MAG: hypothetical protein GF331_09405 [Chitinivibrionales bacterium]|nr:hypothetical protein [Chitinivibrionales bacterium]